MSNQITVHDQFDRKQLYNLTLIKPHPMDNSLNQETQR